MVIILVILLVMVNEVVVVVVKVVLVVLLWINLKILRAVWHTAFFILVGGGCGVVFFWLSQ